MIKQTLKTAAIAALLASASANAALEPRLDGKAYYDTETNLTWAAPVDARTISEQVTFVSNLVIDGIGGWRIPDWQELPDFITNHSICGDMYCFNRTLLPPLDIYQSSLSWNWVSAGPSELIQFGVSLMKSAVIDFDGIAYGAYGYWHGFLEPVNSSHSFSTWPVHTGDVALVPEPATYAMLLAGLGLLGVVRIKWKL